MGSTQFRDSESCPAAVVTLSEEVEAKEGPGLGLNPEHCMDFNPGVETDTTFGLVVSSGATLFADLQWAEPRDGVESDLDAFLLNSAEEPIGELAFGTTLRRRNP